MGQQSCYISSNTNTLDINSFSIHSDGTKGQLQKTGEGNCYDNNAYICYKLTPIVELGLYNGIHLGTHLWTYVDIQCLRHLG